MDSLTKRTLKLSVSLLFVSVIVGWLTMALGYGFALYLVPLGMIVAVYLFLTEVHDMIYEITEPSES